MVTVRVAWRGAEIRCSRMTWNASSTEPQEQQNVRLEAKREYGEGRRNVEGVEMQSLSIYRRETDPPATFFFC